MDKALDLAQLWWEAGVKSAMKNWPEATSDKWEEISAGDKAFMVDAANLFIQAISPAPSPSDPGEGG